jgi:translocation and assembly module TamB
VDGRVTGNAAPDITFTANLPNVAPFVPKMNGPLSLTGDLQQISASRWNVGADLIGPAGTTATLNGSVSPNGRMDISINGDAQLALANPFLTPRSISGDATFNLRVNGPPDISSISGTIRASNARAVAPNLQLALQNIAAEVSLSSGRANIDLNGQVSNGGRLRLTGPLGLTGSMPANLRMALDGVVIEDPSLYKTTLDGELGVDGPLLSNARISGRIDVGETQISIPSSGISSFGTIPNITHVNVPTKVQRTRVKAGLVQTEDQSSSASGPRYPLDITISAPRQIFVRGRGLDAELGGQLRLTGTTANIISAGRFELQRGRLDILSKRFNLDEGIIQLQGDFDPFIRFVAITNTDVGTASVVVEGLATDPEVRFESSPDAPQDEVLAQIFFGRDVSQISALQALQLASAVATLAGRGGEGVVSKLRRSFDLDDLDITTDEQGNAGLRAGKYISDNIYTDVTVGTNNNAEVSLNIDITPTITATGKLGSDGDTSLGIYFQKDY